MSFISIFLNHSLDEEAESFTDNYFLKSDMKTIKMSLDMFIEDENLRNQVLKEIQELKMNISDSSLREACVNVLGDKSLRKTEFITAVKNNLKENDQQISPKLLTEIDDLVKIDFLNRETKGKSVIYSLSKKSASKENEPYQNNSQKRKQNFSKDKEKVIVFFKI